MSNKHSIDNLPVSSIFCYGSAKIWSDFFFFFLFLLFTVFFPAVGRWTWSNHTDIVTKLSFPFDAFVLFSFYPIWLTVFGF